MKKILLIGKFNETVKNLNDCLAQKFQVQLCSEKSEVVSDLLRIVKPDLILVSLIGFYDDVDRGIFHMLSTEHRNLPVLTIGTQAECSRYLKYYEDGQFVNLLRPINHSKVLTMCLDCLRSRGKLEMKNARKHILVVDDNPIMLRTMKAMLESRYSVALAPSGMKAMTSIGKKKPDLILLDYEMPVCDGRMTLEMIREEEDMKDIPVIFLTGVSDKAHIEAVIKLRPAGYFLKPVAEEMLMEAIEKELGKKEETEEKELEEKAAEETEENNS